VKILLNIIAQIILIIGTFSATITDMKTGYIFDYITYPMVALGIIISLIQMWYFNLISGAIVFILLFIIYKFGGIGGGDVKLFTGIALLNPFNEINFLITLIIVASTTSILFYSIYYSLKYFRKFGFKEIKRNELIKGVLIFFVLLIYFFTLYTFNMVNELFVLFFGIPFLFASIYLIIQKEVMKEFFEKKVKLSELGDDEVFSINNSKNILDLLKNKKLLGKKEITILKKNKIKEIIILYTMPKFGPFIFIGTIFAILFPNLITLIF
jgi:Flp pilus assembly protein protease CpaA